MTEPPPRGKDARDSFLVTGAAGFIGYHVCKRLLDSGLRVVGVDNLNDYYSIALKEQRLAMLESEPGFTAVRADIADASTLREAADSVPDAVVIHLAAQAGVRYSLENPLSYVHSNLVGFANVLELCRANSTPHLVYASSSSVYGGNRQSPFSVSHPVDHPLNLYAATKKSNELMAHSYSHLFGVPSTGVRFFTVYGPWGRPDMAMLKFSEKIHAGEPIDVYNQGDMYRDFTYIDDVVEGLMQISAHAPRKCEKRPSDSSSTPIEAPYRVYNLGNSRPEHLGTVIDLLESSLGATARRNSLPMQPGDMLSTAADMQAMRDDFGFEPCTSIQEGVTKFCDWFKQWKAQQ